MSCSVHDPDFGARYGPWALVAGASEGLGAEFATQLAGRGLHLLLVARRAALLDKLACQLRAAHGVQVRTAALDLAAPDLPALIAHAVAELEIGLLVYNAALTPRGPFLAQTLEALRATVAVNCLGPLVLAHQLGQPMATRGRGGILLMSSMAALQGSALVATYAASKAFDRVLAEGLWFELRERGVDVLACCAGPTSTPSYLSSQPRSLPLSPPVQDAAAVVAEALEALGHTPSMVPGRVNRLAAAIMQRLLPRRWAVEIMGRTMHATYPAD